MICAKNMERKIAEAYKETEETRYDSAQSARESQTKISRYSQGYMLIQENTSVLETQSEFKTAHYPLLTGLLTHAKILPIKGGSGCAKLLHSALCQ